ncbi:MAG: hypothetical protein V3U75_13380 [Methylococcaceae bacterium]
MRENITIKNAPDSHNTLMAQIETKLTYAFDTACSIQERQIVFIDKMLGALPQTEDNEALPVPEGDILKIIYAIDRLNARLDRTRNEQTRLNEIVDI